MKKKFMHDLSGKVFFVLISLVGATFDPEFLASSWAKIVTVTFVIIIFFGEIIWDFLKKIYERRG